MCVFCVLKEVHADFCEPTTCFVRPPCDAPPQAQSFSFAARFSNDAGTPIIITPTALAARESAIDLRNKDVPGVRKWLVETVRIDAEDADILVKHKMDGELLLKATEDELVKLYGVPGGPASKIVDAVSAAVSPLGAAAAKGACPGAGVSCVCVCVRGWERGR